jgi:hypothetical protein
MRDGKQGAKRDIQLELKALRLNGMAAAWAELFNSRRQFLAKDLLHKIFYILWSYRAIPVEA